MTLGVQVQRSTNEAIAIVARSQIAKGVNNVDILTKAPPNALRLYRHVFNSNDLTNPRRDADVILSDLGTYRHPNLYVETQNELPKEKLTEYISYLKLIVPMLRAQGLNVIGPSWATGDYEQGDWDAFRSAGWCGLNGISLHAYWATAGFTPWNALRWRTYYDSGRDRQLPIVVSECGRDICRDGPNGSLVGHGGWKADGLSPEAYAAELNAYGSQLLPHEHATVFVAGAEPNWDKYDLAPLAHLIQTGGSNVVAPKPTPVPIAPKPPMFSVGQGVHELMLKNGDKPASSEHYINDANGAVFKSETVGGKGIYSWYKETGQTVLLPFGTAAPKV